MVVLVGKQRIWSTGRRYWRPQDVVLIKQVILIGESSTWRVVHVLFEALWGESEGDDAYGEEVSLVQACSESVVPYYHSVLGICSSTMQKYHSVAPFSRTIELTEAMSRSCLAAGTVHLVPPDPNSVPDTVSLDPYSVPDNASRPSLSTGHGTSRPLLSTVQRVPRSLALYSSRTVETVASKNSVLRRHEVYHMTGHLHSTTNVPEHESVREHGSDFT